MTKDQAWGLLGWIIVISILALSTVIPLLGFIVMVLFGVVGPLYFGTKSGVKDEPGGL